MCFCQGAPILTHCALCTAPEVVWYIRRCDSVHGAKTTHTHYDSAPRIHSEHEYLEGLQDEAPCPNLEQQLVGKLCQKNTAQFYFLCCQVETQGESERGVLAV